MDLAGTNPATLALLNPSGPQPFIKLKQTPREALTMTDSSDMGGDEEGAWLFFLWLDSLGRGGEGRVMHVAGAIGHLSLRSSHVMNIGQTTRS